MIWCAKPDDLNDKDEFRFQCDCRPTKSTIPLLSKILMKYRNIPLDISKLFASIEINNNRLKGIATPIIDNIINDCRSTLGVTCFSTLRNNKTLWDRYGGCGNGVCIEIDFPDNLLNQILFNITYVAEKIFHIDSIIESDLYKNKRDIAYRNILLTKTNRWVDEEEVRIITKQQDVQMIIDGSITEIIFGNQLPIDIRRKIKTAINDHFGYHSMMFTEMD